MEIHFDMIFSLHNKHRTVLYTFELTAEFKSNLETNSDCKFNTYRPNDARLSSIYNGIKFAYVSLSTLSALDTTCDS